MARKDEAAGRDRRAKRPYLHVLNDKGRWNGKVLPLPENLTIPLKRKKSTTYFVNSMSDLFHEAVPFEFINKVWAVMLAASQYVPSADQAPGADGQVLRWQAPSVERIKRA